MFIKRSNISKSETPYKALAALFWNMFVCLCIFMAFLGVLQALIAINKTAATIFFVVIFFSFVFWPKNSD